MTELEIDQHRFRKRFGKSVRRIRGFFTETGRRKKEGFDEIVKARENACLERVLAQTLFL